MHSVKYNRWTTKEKLVQYRGILKLHARNQKLQTGNVLKKKRKFSRKLRSLSEDVKNYGVIVDNVLKGDKRFLTPLFSEDKNLLLTHINLPISEILMKLHQDSCSKQKHLDKLFFLKKQKIKEFFELKEIIISNNFHEKEEGNVSTSYRVHQSLITQYQRSMARLNAAQSIRNTYELMIKILKNDAIYFDAILGTLSKDQKEQCKIILKTTMVGQLVAENVDDNRQKYKHLSNEVSSSVKERENTLKIARIQVEDIFMHVRTLIRGQSEADFTNKAKMISNNNELEEKIKTLEQIFGKMKESLCVQSDEELQLRLEKQFAQKNKLSEQLEEALKKNDSFIKRKQHAELILATLEHAKISTKEKYKLKKQEMLEKIGIKKSYQKNVELTGKSQGKLLMEIRVALQSLTDMLIMVDTNKLNEEENLEENETSMEHLPTVIDMLVHVEQNIILLKNISNFKLDKENQERAKDLYETYISNYKSNVKFDEKEPDFTNGLEEYEIADLKVLTRKEIKKRSKQIIEARSKDE